MGKNPSLVFFVENPLNSRHKCHARTTWIIINIYMKKYEKVHM